MIEQIAKFKDMEINDQLGIVYFKSIKTTV